MLPAIIVALVIFVVTLAASLGGLYAKPQIIERSLFRPYYFLRRKQYDTIVTSGFVHADLPHLIFNMVTFYFFAFPLERAFAAGLTFRIGTCSVPEEWPALIPLVQSGRLKPERYISHTLPLSAGSDAYAAFEDYRMGGVTLSAKAIAVLKRRLVGEVVTQEASGMSKGEWREFEGIWG